jgi:uncharacterized protein
MPKDAPYIVLVREMPCHRHFDVPATLVGDWLRGLPMREALGAPDPDPAAGSGAADLDLHADGTHVSASGTFHGHLVVACSRCIGPVRLDLDENLRVTFMPSSELPTDDEAAGEDGAEVSEEDVDTFAFDGERVDVEPVLREQFVLAIPFAPLCREDCKGLCPQCGIDLNTGTCACEKPTDPRLAALKGLKIPP